MTDGKLVVRARFNLGLRDKLSNSQLAAMSKGENQNGGAIRFTVGAGTISVVGPFRECPLSSNRRS